MFCLLALFNCFGVGWLDVWVCGLVVVVLGGL